MMGLFRSFAKAILCLYPYEWQQHYREEFEAVLEQHTVSFHTLTDMFVGAIDAHLSGGSIMQRLRLTTIAVFCAYFPFALAYMYFERNLIDPYSPFLSLFQVHPELRFGQTLIELGNFGAFFALLAGGIPVMFSIVRNAWINKQYTILKVLAFVPVSIIVFLAVSATLFIDLSTKAHAKDIMPFDIGLAIVWLAIFGITGLGSVISISIAIARSAFTDWLLRYTYWPAIMMTGSMFVGFAGMIYWGVGLAADSPGLYSSYGYSPLFYIDALTMALASIFALFFVWRGLSPFLSSLKETVGRA